MQDAAGSHRFERFLDEEGVALAAFVHRVEQRGGSLAGEPQRLPKHAPGGGTIERCELDATRHTRSDEFGQDRSQRMPTSCGSIN